MNVAKIAGFLTGFFIGAAVLYLLLAIAARADEDVKKPKANPQPMTAGAHMAAMEKIPATKLKCWQFEVMEYWSALKYYTLPYYSIQQHTERLMELQEAKSDKGCQET